MHPDRSSSKYPSFNVTFMSVIYNCVKAVCGCIQAQTHMQCRKRASILVMWSEQMLLVYVCVQASALKQFLFWFWLLPELYGVLFLLSSSVLSMCIISSFSGPVRFPLGLLLPGLGTAQHTYRA